MSTPESARPNARGASTGSRHVTIAPADATHRRSGSDDASASSPKRARLACQHCRQSKLRCQNNGSGEPCVRCGRSGLECVYDDLYRRVNKRLKVQQLVEEVQQLRSAVQGTALASDQSNSLVTSPQSSRGLEHRPSNTDDANISSAAAAAPPVVQRDGPFLPSVEQNHSSHAIAGAEHSRRLDNTVLSPPQIDNLFSIYFTQYHSFFPILDATVLPDQCYSLSPPLFWVIIGIASRHYEDDTTLMGILAPSVRDLLFRVAGLPPHNRYTIKAFILLCLWKFPTSSQTTDPSYILISAARASAMHVGLHRPEIVQDYSRVKIRFGPSELHDAIQTWVGCFIAAESVTSFMGQPSLFGPDPTLDFLVTHAQHDSLPEEIMTLLQAFRFAQRVHSVMGNRESRSGRLLASETSVLLPMLENELERLCSRTSSKPVNVEIILLYMCLQLRCYHFFEEPGLVSRKEGLLKGYAAALELAVKSHEAQTRIPFFKYAPDIFYHPVCVAAMFIMKIVKSTYVSEVDVTQAKRAFSICHSIIRQMSLEDNDLPGRTGKIVEQLWNSEDSRRLNMEPTLKIKTRLGGSLIHDTLWEWREKFGGQASMRTSPCPSPRTSTVSGNPTQPPGLHPALQRDREYIATDAARRPIDEVNSTQVATPEQEPVHYSALNGTRTNQELIQQPYLDSSVLVPNEPFPSITQDSQVISSGPTSSFDFALMPEDYIDSYWETQLDGLMSLEPPP